MNGPGTDYGGASACLNPLCDCATVSSSTKGIKKQNQCLAQQFRKYLFLGHPVGDDDHNMARAKCLYPVFLGGQCGPDYGSLPALRRSTYHQGAAAQSHLEEILRE